LEGCAHFFSLRLAAIIGALVIAACLTFSPSPYDTARGYVLSGDHTLQMPSDVQHRKATGLDADHQFEDPCQGRCRIDVHDCFDHNLGHRATHQFIVMCISRNSI
jgi:hypothetical protein